jgi:regulatory protein
VQTGKGPAIHEQRAAEAGQVARLIPAGRDGSRITVEFTSGWSLTIDAGLVIEHGVEVGGSLSVETVRTLIDRDDLIHAKRSAGRLLAYRPRSVAELRTSLRQRGYRDETIHLVVERFTELGYLDDEDFARRWVATRAAVAPRSTRLLKAELRQKGVAPSEVESALVDANLDDVQTALDLARRRVCKMVGVDLVSQRRRISDYLQRRGYGWDVIRQVDREVFASGPSDVSGDHDS